MNYGDYNICIAKFYHTTSNLNQTWLDKRSVPVFIITVYFYTALFT